MIFPPVEELLVLLLLLLGVIVGYYLLKLHYIFAFGLVENTSISTAKKQKIKKIKNYVFIFLKLLLVIGLFSMSLYGVLTLLNGQSLKVVVMSLWQEIPKEFWLTALMTIIRAGLFIVLMRYLFKILFIYLEKQKAKTLSVQTYEIQKIDHFYETLYQSIKYIIVFGVVYRIMLVFPFLDTLVYMFGLFLLVFICYSFVNIVFKYRIMIRSK